MSKRRRLLEKFGGRLRELRQEAGMTQLELAREVDVTPEHIGRLEQGKNAPSFQTLELLADALDVPVKTLFDFDSP